MRMRVCTHACVFVSVSIFMRASVYLSQSLVCALHSTPPPVQSALAVLLDTAFAGDFGGNYIALSSPPLCRHSLQEPGEGLWGCGLVGVVC